jgi:hypothetical protein
MFKWTISCNQISSASIKSAWDIWKDVKNWPEWDDEIEWSKLEGDFALHTKGYLKPKGMGVFQFQISELSDGKSFTTQTKMFMAKMVDVHTVRSIENSKTELQQSVTVSGPLAPFLYFVMRKNLQNGLGKSLKKLAKLAEGGQSYE